MELKVVAHAAATDTGRRRQANEDAYFVDGPLFAVADGMGGAQAGDVAARIATEALVGVRDSDTGPEQLLERVITEANRRIHDLAERERRYRGMGTTMTVALVQGSEVVVGHVGDSRAYRLRDGELVRLTLDHSLVGEMVRRGAITEADAEVHPQRSIITRALGSEPAVEVDVHTHPARRGDIYLICSDGLTGMITEPEIAAALSREPTLDAAVAQLIARANANGGVDNITIVTFALDGDGGDGAPGDPSAPAAAEVTDGSRDRSGATLTDRPALDPGTRRRMSNRRQRFVLAAILSAIVVAISLAGAVIGGRQVYFIGVDEHGLITLYRGTPYELPVGLKLYQETYVTTTPATALPPAERARLLDHRSRSRRDAESLIKSLEAGELKVVAP